MTRDQIEAIAAGCEGVTPGSWRLEATTIYGDPDGGMWSRIALGPYPHSSARSTRHKQWVADALHIARLDPATVRELCRLALIGLDAETRVASAEAAVRNAALEEAAKVATQAGGHGFSYADYPSKRTAEHQAYLIAEVIRAMKEPT